MGLLVGVVGTTSPLAVRLPGSATLVPVVRKPAGYTPTLSDEVRVALVDDQYEIIAHLVDA